MGKAEQENTTEQWDSCPWQAVVVVAVVGMPNNTDQPNATHLPLSHECDMLIQLI